MSEWKLFKTALIVILVILFWFFPVVAGIRIAKKKNIPPHYNNGHKLFQQSYFDERLFFAGAEINTEFPGYIYIYIYIRCGEECVYFY